MEGLTIDVRFGQLCKIVFEDGENDRSVIGYEVAIGSLRVLLTNFGSESSTDKLHIRCVI